MSLKHFWEQWGLLMGNKGYNPKRLKDHGNIYPPPPGRGCDAPRDVIMSWTLKVMGNHVIECLWTVTKSWSIKGNHVKFARFVLLVVSEEAKT